eukprot:1926661-Pyramimonas_sp.AAC.2
MRRRAMRRTITSKGAKLTDRMRRERVRRRMEMNNNTPVGSLHGDRAGSCGAQHEVVSRRKDDRATVATRTTAMTAT